MANKINEEMVAELYETIVKLESAQDCKNLFDDMCTYKEIMQMAQRLRAAKLLTEGKTYNKVIEETDISSATLSRVSACVQRGKGYKKVFEK